MEAGIATRARASVLAREVYDLTQAMVALDKIRTELEENRQVEVWIRGYNTRNEVLC